jgi:hypothetical protein
VRIGYSFWGFLGPGITDTPDGGRSHRKVLVDALADAGHRLVFLQIDRDLAETGHDLGDRYHFDIGFPDIDALFLEWRWPITGRNTSPCGRPGHTCDLHRQNNLVQHYTARGTPTIVWDKDLRLPTDDPLRSRPNVAVAEAALHPRDAFPLLFPVDDAVLDAAGTAALARAPRELPLVYVGNQYDRDSPFDTFFAPAADKYRHRIAGKWPDTRRWPNLNFTGRIPFAQVAELHASALATVLLLPDRYAAIAQVTQRLPEAVLSGCLPITPSTLRDATAFTPAVLHADDGAGVIAVLEHLADIAGRPAHTALIHDCLHRLDLFRVSRQVAAIQDALHALEAIPGVRRAISEKR